MQNMLRLGLVYCLVCVFSDINLFLITTSTRDRFSRREWDSLPFNFDLVKTYDPSSSCKRSTATFFLYNL